MSNQTFRALNRILHEEFAPLTSSQRPPHQDLRHRATSLPGLTVHTQSNKNMTLADRGAPMNALLDNVIKYFQAITYIVIVS